MAEFWAVLRHTYVNRDAPVGVIDEAATISTHEGPFWREYLDKGFQLFSPVEGRVLEVVLNSLGDDSLVGFLSEGSLDNNLKELLKAIVLLRGLVGSSDDFLDISKLAVPDNPSHYIILKTRPPRYKPLSKFNKKHDLSKTIIQAILQPVYSTSSSL